MSEQIDPNIQSKFCKGKDGLFSIFDIKQAKIAGVGYELGRDSQGRSYSTWVLKWLNRKIGETICEERG